MANNFSHFRHGLSVIPYTTAASAAGDIRFDSAASNAFKYHDGSSERSVANLDGTQTFTNKTIDRSLNTLTNLNIVNADVNAAAAIAYSKLNLTASIVNADIAAGAAIAYSKLNLSASIVNADIAAGAAIAYSKLNLSNSIVDADINASAAIAYSKLAALTANRALQSDGSGFVSVSAVTSTELGYVSGVTSAIQTQLNNKLNRDGTNSPTADINWGGFKITNLGTPTAASDAATKSYVDSAIYGLAWKDYVVAASTANVAIATELENGDTLDGVTLATNDRVLLKDQTAPAQNGIYVVQASGAAVRAVDMDAWDEVVSAAVFCSEGTVNADRAYVCTSDEGGTLGTTAISFVQFSSSNAYIGGNGINITGNTIDVDHDGEGLTFVSTQLALELDGSTLSKSASGLKVATGGITNNEVNAAAAIAYSKLNLSNSIVNADINASAAIAYSKLNLTASIVNADIAAGAAIAYSKLNLSASIVNADIAAGAAIAYNKLAALTASRALVSDGSGFVSVSSVTSASVSWLLDNDALANATLVDNTASATDVTGASWTVASFDSIELSYSIKRGATYEKGMIHITSDGTNAGIDNSYAGIGNSGVDFSVVVSGGNLKLQYTTTSTGADAKMRFKVQKWLSNF